MNPYRSLALVNGPLLRILYKVLVLLALMSVLISATAHTTSTTSSSSHISTLGNYEIDDSGYVEVSRSVEPQVLARLESRFLKLFGMPQRPAKRNKPIKVPKYLVDLYNAQADNELSTSNLNLPGRHTRTANTVRTFYHLLSNTETGWGQYHRVKFDLSSIPEKEKVTGAELRVVFSKNLEHSEEVQTQKSDNDQKSNSISNNNSNSNDIVNNNSDSDNIKSNINSVNINLNNKENNIISELNSDNMGSYDSVRVLVNDVIRPPKNDGDEPIMFPIDSKLIDLKRRRNDSFWITLDIFPAVSRWMENPKRNHGVVIQVVHLNGKVMYQSTQKHIRVRREAPNATGAQSTATENDPVLFTYSDDGVNKKQRDAKALTRAYRAANGGNGNKKRKNHRNKNRKRNLCSRHKMFVDFLDVGWDSWIVAPPGYHAFHCAGECPFPMAEQLNATNHAVIQALVNSMNPQMVPPPCCVPSKYSSLSLLYTDSSDKIVLKNYNEMVVDSCGCS